MACGPQRTAAHGVSVTALHLLLHFILALIVLLSTVAFALMTCFHDLHDGIVADAFIHSVDGGSAGGDVNLSVSAILWMAA
eukprot:scaffold16071_cov70-Skeletonema_dohrnii-CCMP3373.AAC.2